MHLRIIAVSTVAVLSFVALRVSAAPSDPEEVARLRRAAVEAYRAKDWPAFLESTKKAAALQPDRAGSLYNLACAEARNGHTAEAARLAAALLDRGVDFGLETDDDMAPLRASAEWPKLAERLAKLKTPVATSEPAFRLPERDLLTEGIAYDGKTKTFFVSSVRKRKIVKRGAAGTVSDFVTSGRDGLLGVLALRVDEKRRVLWATSAALPQMEGFTKELEGKGAVLRFDLSTGKLLGKADVPADGKRHNLNDVTLDGNGNAYVSDAFVGAVYRVAHDGNALELFLSPGTVRSAQGLALSANEKTLYLADYGEGLFAVDVATKAVRPVTAPSGIPLVGIDGLVRARPDVLVVTQNGIRPERVVKLTLDASGEKVTAAKVLEKGSPALVEPTLGVMVDGWFHYIANAAWDSYGEDGSAPPADKLQEPLVLRAKP